METGVIFAIAFSVAFALFIFIRIMAKKDHTFGRICRWYWNTSFKIAAYIPFMGWMTHFIIADTIEEKETKQRYINIGIEADKIANDVMDEYERKHRILQAKRERIEKELSQLGYSNIRVDVDSNSAYCEDINGNSYQISVNWN